jgi:hypothetical protein
MTQNDKIEEVAQKIVTQMISGKTFEVDEIVEIQNTDGLIGCICKEVRKLPSSEIVKCLYELDGLSVVIVEDIENKQKTYGGYYNSDKIVELFTDLLFIQDFNVGRNVCAILAAPGHFPDSTVRNNNEKIIKAAVMYPKTPMIVRLLGMTGSEKAKELIQKKTVDDSKENVAAALAKLGDLKMQDFLIEQYGNAVPGRQKEELALLLGYIHSVKSLLALAKDFRTMQTYIWHEPSAKRSVRVDIIKGLHVAFPEEPIFWKPEFEPSDDSYYENIEKWLTKNLGVKWDKSRPPFLYEIEAPF